jgi:hypothetical protein
MRKTDNSSGVSIMFVRECSGGIGALCGDRGHGGGSKDQERKSDGRHRYDVREYEECGGDKRSTSRPSTGGQGKKRVKGEKSANYASDLKGPRLAESEFEFLRDI